ncbi:MAG: DUF4249 domain-containing protein [Bacteroidetes bacterium]|nr:DUF4249 domain-containing protein [Bacteroidota bacterium]MBL6944935.1 DUF4249 domain-containing protein [Bacteroidales bacterium]
MKQIKNIIAILFLLFSITSCVEKYWPDITKYENILVVDGMLTNGDEPVVVKLSVSSAINNLELTPVSGGELYITDEDQIKTYLIEMEPGTYQVHDSFFRGNVGNSYQLHILLPNGRNYISDICRLTSPSPIDSLYGLLESPEYISDKKEKHGYQFYIDNHSNTADTCYYLWKLSHTYEYKSTFDIDYIWDGAIIPYPDPDSLRTCWRTTNVNEIFTYSTEYLDPPVIINFPLNFISTKTKMLSIKYSLLVKQLSISEDAFNFWDALRQQDIEQGNLYSQQPIQIVGNIHNVNNANEPVLGYFTIAGVTEKRIFVRRPGLRFYYDICEPDFEALAYINFSNPEFWPIYLTIIPDRGLAGAAQEVCFDCRLEGGNIIPPDFW